MRRILIFPIILLTFLLSTSCHNEYFEQIKEYDERVAALQAACDQMNSDIFAIRVLVNSIQSKDMISGISAIFSDDNKELGYKINFIKHDPITIYHGQNGNIPLIGSKVDKDGNYYWTLKYGNGPEEWILGPNGEKILSMGIVPVLRIRNDRWEISYDGLKTWEDIGQASGGDGDTMFKRIYMSDPDFVTITLTNGTTFQIPKFTAYQQVVEDVAKSRQNVNAQEVIIEALLDSAIYIKSTKEIVSDGETVGTEVLLSNGKQITINNWLKSNIPVIYARYDFPTAKFYWSIRYGKENSEWILDENGEKILVHGANQKPPVIDIKEDEDGYYYWAVTYPDGTTSFIKDAKGQRPRALESEYFSAFKEVDNSDPDYLKVTLLDDKVYLLPKEHTVEIPSMVMASVGEDIKIDFKIYGENTENVSLTFFCEGGARAYLSAPGEITIEAPFFFTGGKASVLIFFKIHESLTIVKSVNIIEQV